MHNYKLINKFPVNIQISKSKESNHLLYGCLDMWNSCKIEE